MSSGNSNEVSIDFSMHWLFMPPITAILTILLTGLVSTSMPISVDPAIWGLVGLMFVLLTVLYGIFIKQSFFRGLLPVQLIAQGILLCPLSLRMGASMFQWVGVLSAICGAVILVAIYYHSRTYCDMAIQYVLPQSELDTLPLPFAITDGEGGIISVSDHLLQLVQKARPAVNGKNISTILPLDKEVANIGGKEWRILSTNREDGTIYFQLEEAREVIVTLPATGANGSFLDPATSLYDRTYAVKRVGEELYRTYRYKRWMSAALLCVDFPEASPAIDSKKEDEIFNSYCRFINSITRATDISCLVGPRDILIVMPETLLDGARDVVSKLSDFTALSKEEAQWFNEVVKIREGVIFLSASSGTLDFDGMMAKLDEALK